MFLSKEGYYQCVERFFIVNEERSKTEAMPTITGETMLIRLGLFLIFDEYVPYGVAKKVHI